MKTNKPKPLTYNDLILLKALFNKDLNNAVMDESTSNIDKLMLSRYSKDLQSHNIIDFRFNVTETKQELINICLNDDLKWAL